jgi:hypothetical protein
MRRSKMRSPSAVDVEEVAAEFAAAQEMVTRAALGQAGSDLGRQFQVPLPEHPRVLAVVGLRRLPRFDDQRTVEAEGNLQRRIGMGVIPTAARRRGHELVDEFLSWLDRRLVQPGRPIHLRRKMNAMPVDRGRDR